MPTAKPRARRSCFIVGPIGTELNVIRNALAGRNIDVLECGQTRIAGPSLVSMVKQADFVCVLLGDTAFDPATFAAGVAVGLRKPTLLVGEESIPLDAGLLGLTRIDTAHSIENELNAFLTLKFPEQMDGISDEKEPTRSGAAMDFTWARDQLQLSLSAELVDSPQSAVQFQDLIAEAFRRAGYSVTVLPFDQPDIRYDPLSGAGADMAVSSARVQQELGGPVLVRVKCVASSFPPAFQEAQRLSQLINDGWGSAGLLVLARQSPETDVILVEVPLVLGVPAQRLISLLEQDELLSTISDKATPHPGWSD